MKKAIALFTTAVVLFTGASLYAEDAAKATPKNEKVQPMTCCVFMELCDLFTKDQKAKATALHAECHKAKYSSEAQAKFFKAVKALLTPKQISACKASCEKDGFVGCPICGGAKPKDQPKAESKS